MNLQLNNPNKKKVPNIGTLDIGGMKQKENQDNRVGHPTEGINRIGVNDNEYDAGMDVEYDEDFNRFNDDDDEIDYEDSEGRRYSNADSDSTDDLKEEMLDQVKEVPKFNIPIHRIPKFDDRDQPDIDDVLQAEKIGDYGNIRPTQRTDIKIQYYSQKCSEIIPVFFLC